MSRDPQVRETVQVLNEAIEACREVQAHWQRFHSVAPSAAANCAEAIEKLRDRELQSSAGSASLPTLGGNDGFPATHEEAMAEMSMTRQEILESRAARKAAGSASQTPAPVLAEVCEGLNGCDLPDGHPIGDVPHVHTKAGPIAINEAQWLKAAGVQTIPGVNAPHFVTGMSVAQSSPAAAPEPAPPSADQRERDVAEAKASHKRALAASREWSAIMSRIEKGTDPPTISETRKAGIGLYAALVDVLAADSFLIMPAVVARTPEPPPFTREQVMDAIGELSGSWQSQKAIDMLRAYAATLPATDAASRNEG